MSAKNALNAVPGGFWLGLGAVIGLGVVGYVVLRRVWGEIPPGALNPTSSANVVNTGVNAVGQVLTDDKDFTLGGWLYSVLNKEPDLRGLPDVQGGNPHDMNAPQ